MLKCFHPRFRCFDDDAENGLDDDGNAIEDQPKGGKGRRNRMYKSVFMEGVPGVSPFHQEPQLSELQRMVQRMCGFNK